MIIMGFVVIMLIYGTYLSFQAKQKAMEFGDSYTLLITYVVEYIF